MTDVTEPPDTTRPPTCPRCLELGPIEIDENARLRVDFLTRYDQVAERLGDPRQTNVTHSIRLEGLRYQCRIERPIRCGLPDKTPHNEGMIVDTACGMTLNIGHVCGATWIEGLATLVAIRTRTTAYDSDMLTIRNGPAELRAEIEALTAAAALLVEARIGIVDYIAPLSKHMRAASTNERLREVIIETREQDLQGRERVLQSTHTLRGVELWRETPDHAALLRRLDVLAEDITQASGENADLNDEHAAFARRVRAVKRDLAPLRTWVDEASRFFAEANLAAALYAAKVEGAVISNGGIVVMHDGKPRRMSRDGAH